VSAAERRRRWAEWVPGPPRQKEEEGYWAETREWVREGNKFFSFLFSLFLLKQFKRNLKTILN